MDRCFMIGGNFFRGEMRHLFYFLIGFSISLLGIGYAYSEVLIDCSSLGVESIHDTYSEALSACSAASSSAGGGACNLANQTIGETYVKSLKWTLFGVVHLYPYQDTTYGTLVCSAGPDSDGDGDGIPDDCDVYPDDPTDYQVGLSSYQTNSADELVRQCFITDRGDVVCFGAAYDNSLVDNLIFNPDFEAADSLCGQKDPGENFSEPDDHESSGDFDDDGTVNGKDPDIDDDGLFNDYDDNDYQYDENDSDPIDPSDPFDDSGALPLPNGFEDDLNYYPNDLFGDSNVGGSGDGATSQDIRQLSSDQHSRVVYLNSEQSLRHNDLKNHIGDTAEFLNSEEYNRDQTAEHNADLRHNDLKDQVDSKFSALDKNQVIRNVNTNSAISNVKTSVDAVGTGISGVKTSVDAVGTGINTVFENINATNQNLESLVASLGISNGHLSGIEGELKALDIPTAEEIGESIGNNLIDTEQTIDTTITDNIPDLDETETLTAINTKYSGRYDLFITTLKGSDLFSLPFGIFTGPSGSGASIQTVNIGKWGSSNEQMATIDYSDYDNIWDILRAVLLLLTSFSCFKILVLKKA